LRPKLTLFACVERRSRTCAFAEALTVGGLVLAATAVRIPYLQTIPAFSDELNEVMLGLGILRGEGWPLTNVTSYIGAFYNYLVAAAFFLFGPQIVTPRALVMILGVLTVGATYVLARQVAGPIAGAVAAALLTTSGTHILVNSHIALSSSITPLFVALGVWLVGRVMILADGWSLVWAGLVFGLALQTHPTVIVVLTACGTFLLLRRPGLSLSWWGGLAGLAFLLGYSNMIAHNLGTGFESVSSAFGASGDYQRGRVEVQPTYPFALGSLLLATARLLAGAVDAPLQPAPLLFNPLVVVYSVAAVAGLVLAARRGLALWAFTIALWLLVLPALNWKYANIILSRWINPIAPILYAGIGCTISLLWARLGTHRARYALAVLVAALVVQPLLLLDQHYKTAMRRGQTNEEPLRQARLLAASRDLDEQVVIDASLQNYGLEDGGTVSKALRYALAVGSLPTIRSDVSEERLSAIIGSDTSILLVTNNRKASELQSEFALSPLDVAPASTDTYDYAAYRVTRR
jgi:4-amino-4-deoxy-L-arabinose transferase-like glycosyltransferase